MTKIIITESQFNNLTRSLVSEAVGVPEYILESGEKLYQSVSKVLKNIKDKETNYECDRFNYVSTKLIKRLSKIYSLLSESKIQEEENCIINWDLYHMMREKKYGRPKIQTEYKFKR